MWWTHTICLLLMLMELGKLLLLLSRYMWTVELLLRLLRMLLWMLWMLLLLLLLLL